MISRRIVKPDAYKIIDILPISVLLSIRLM